MLGIYELALRRPAWDIPNMAASNDKKAESQNSATAIAARLAKLQPPDLSERQWCDRAGVSASFFSNLRGTPTKPPSDPSVVNLKKVLSVVGVTLAEFFSPESAGRVAAVPTRRDLEQAFEDALPSLPKKGRAEFLASVVRDVLALPGGRPAIPGDEETIEPDGHEEAVPARRATTIA